MIFASVNAGHYLLIEDDKVIAEIRRDFLRYPIKGAYWSDGYTLTWKHNGNTEKFRNLPEVHEIYGMENYPGYGRVLHGKVLKA